MRSIVSRKSSVASIISPLSPSYSQRSRILIDHRAIRLRCRRHSISSTLCFSSIRINSSIVDEGKSKSAGEASRLRWPRRNFADLLPVRALGGTMSIVRNFMCPVSGENCENPRCTRARCADEAQQESKAAAIAGTKPEEERRLLDTFARIVAQGVLLDARQMVSDESIAERMRDPAVIEEASRRLERFHTRNSIAKVHGVAAALRWGEELMEAEGKKKPLAIRPGVSSWLRGAG